MTAEQAAKWDGTANVAFDPCYHQACDTFDNVNLVALDEMSDAIAHAILTFAMTTSAVQGTDKGSDKATYDPIFRGHTRHQIAASGWGCLITSTLWAADDQGVDDVCSSQSHKL